MKDLLQEISYEISQINVSSAETLATSKSLVLIFEDLQLKTRLGKFVIQSTKDLKICDTRTYYKRFLYETLLRKSAKISCDFEELPT